MTISLLSFIYGLSGKGYLNRIVFPTLKKKLVNLICVITEVSYLYLLFITLFVRTFKKCYNLLRVNIKGLPMEYTAYYRVSTRQQGNSGLGLEAQKTAVSNFIKSRGATEVPPPFIEVESGKNNNRPKLKQAIKHCKQNGTTLLIAKLDRLSRNASFILNLKDELQQANVEFIACDMPQANTLTLGIMAVMAQHEAEIISERTKAGLAEAKRRGVELGNPENLTDEAREKAHASISRKARTDQSVRHAFHFIKPLRDRGLSYGKIADQLNSEGYKTRTGKDFHAIQVQRIYKRLSD